jgi:hypothetical protein
MTTHLHQKNPAPHRLMKNLCGAAFSLHYLHFGTHQSPPFTNIFNDALRQ